MSNTFISISDVPVFGGDPPSTAVNKSCIFAFFSRSKAFCSTNSGDILSPLLCVARLKYSLALSLYVLTPLYVLIPFFPTSAS
uniref:Uncharacterized protein n=1 Tax=Amphilophus citrinellus TaxID=61819 RepID=A0A3Q0SC92_AMPCI